MAKRWIPISALLAGVLATAGSAQPGPGPNLEGGAMYFDELSQACEQRDGGRLWGTPVCGPVLLIDPTTRRVVANQADGEGVLEQQNGVYVGSLPPDQPVANAPVEWAGVRWAMVVVQFLSGDTPARVTILAHESFHRVEPGLGLYPFNDENGHLDEADGRYWMQLEWNALETALSSSGDGRGEAVRDALVFRAARRQRYPDAAPRENAVEIREGLAQYTGLRIAGRSELDVVQDVRARRGREEGIVRSFGYNSGALYGYLLDAADSSWRKDVTRDTDLGVLLSNAMGLRPDPAGAGRRAAAYGGPALREAEDDRARAREERLAAWRTSLLDGPVLIVDLSAVKSGSMNTQAVYPFDETRTVFTIRTLIAEWGRLEVRGGAILEDRASHTGRLSLDGASDDMLTGDGWTLQINDGWTIMAGERPGDFVLVRLD